MIKLNETEEVCTYGGEAITLGSMLAILVIGIVVVVVYKLFFSGSAKITLPGGWNFQWD